MPPAFFNIYMDLITDNLLTVLILLPVIGQQIGLNLDVISTILRTLTGYVISALLLITGNT